MPHPMIPTQSRLARWAGVSACALMLLALEGCGDKGAAPGAAGAPQMPPAEVGVITVQPGSVPVHLSVALVVDTGTPPRSPVTDVLMPKK